MSAQAAATTQAGGGVAQVGVVGLAVMGQNLARNLARNGYTVAVYNRSPARTDAFISAYGEEGSFVPSAAVPEFVASLERPRRILMMVQAGAATDATINALVPYLEPGDVLVDGGNAQFTDTIRREADLKRKAIGFLGVGVSGGEEGALNGPSIMAGGTPEAYALVEPMLERIAAKADGEPCAAYLGPDGAGHFVKMVHNGIEYADMQFIAEAYDLLRGAGNEPARIADVFAEWNGGKLESFLVEITAEVLRQVDQATGKPLVDVIADAAGQKGTGRWTVQSALELGVPVNTIAESVFARSTSSHPRLRAAAQEHLTGPSGRVPGTSGNADVDDDTQLVADVESALLASKIVAYTQGLDQIRTASDQYGWGVDVGSVARIWRAGCIIRARLLARIREAYAGDPDLPTLLAAPDIVPDLTSAQDGWRRAVARAVELGVPVPGFSGALAYYDTVRADRLPAALIQGLRDFFGAHTYARTDRDGVFHTLWSGDRSEVAVVA